MMERLDKFLCSQSTLTRSEAGRAIRCGRVTVDGTVCRQAAQKIDPDKQQVAVDGKAIGYAAFVYWMLNKPAGILCVSRDPKAPTVVDLLPPDARRKGLFPAGRLDKDTHGLVLITDDGDFAHRMLSPRHHIPKTYHARLDKPLPPDTAARFAAGIELEDGTVCKPAQMRVLEEGETPLAEIILVEGKYHQIKRMFAAVGCHVDWLKRVKMGNLPLDESLAEGECRLLTSAEKDSILPINFQQI